MGTEAEERGRWIYSAWKHLRLYDATAMGRMGATAHAGRAGDLLGRLRMLESYPMKELSVLAADAGISHPELGKITVPALESAGGLRVERETGGPAAPTRVMPLVIDQDDVMRILSSVWEAMLPVPDERIAMIALEVCSALPRTQAELAEHCVAAGFDEQSVDTGLELALAVGLVKRRHVAEIGVDLYYNDYLWGDSIARTADALGRLKTSSKEGLVSLLSELHEAEGQPTSSITSASPELIRFAAEHGIIEQTQIVTRDGRTADFAFTPRLRGYGVGKGDIPDELDQVRLVIASFSFAKHHATNRLADPVAFLNKLIDTGVAGSAEPIASDYGALEKQQIVRVEPIFKGARNHRFAVIKRDSLLVARDTMVAGELVSAAPGSDSSLLDSHGFRDSVATRIELGRQSGPAPLHHDELLAAVRDAAQRTRPRSERR